MSRDPVGRFGCKNEFRKKLFNFDISALESADPLRRQLSKLGEMAPNAASDGFTFISAAAGLNTLLLLNH